MKKCRRPLGARTCDDQCGDFCYIGEGDAICNREMPPKLVMDDWSPADDFFWCEGDDQK
ncbi:MAG: hypothetical protein LKJ59_01670 [Oscillospiraceae bacterium]|jgi:hypothetical protein|nr:hypothetical protein [Oscillospiraceae bacterium]MCI2034797.1 hypothetical protein [Oscillospiraceae bacterium]